MREFGFRLMIAIACLCGLLWPCAAAENLLTNGMLEAEQTDFPSYWNHSPAVELLRGGGPDGVNAIRIKAGAEPQFITQPEAFKLVAGEPYRIGGWFKTVDFQATGSRMAVYNYGWSLEAGLQIFPANTNWRYLTQDIVAPASKNGRYGITYRIGKGQGEIYAAKLELTPLSPAGIAQSKALLADALTNGLIPLRPLLHEIPAGNATLQVGWIGQLPGKETECEVVYQLGSGPESRTGLTQKEAVLEFRELKPGADRLRIAVVGKSDRKALFEAVWPLAVVAPPPAWPETARKLNNLVTELAVFKAAPGEQYRFANPRNGFLHIALGAGRTAKLTETGNVIAGAGNLYLPAGIYTLEYQGPGEGTIAVRAIREILYQPLCSGPRIPGSGRYSWAFVKQYLAPVVTTFNGVSWPEKITPEEQADFRSLPLRWLGNIDQLGRIEKPQELLPRIQKLLDDPRFDGGTIDEINLASLPRIALFSEGLPLVKDPGNKIIDVWCYGKPEVRDAIRRLCAVVFNAGNGQGKILFEAYALPQKDETAAREYIHHMIVETGTKFETCYPGALNRLAMILGNYAQETMLSLAHYPAQDYKYYLDMQMNLAATAPELADLGGVGYWGGAYTDEEITRWCAALLRHYAIEGRTDMLSDKYGFTFASEYLKNGDFETDLKLWTVSGKVTTASTEGFGRTIGKRWLAASGVGDHYAVLEASGQISQIATGLTPGRYYALHYVFADADDPMAKNGLPIAVKLEAAVTGGEVSPDFSYQSLAFAPPPNMPFTTPKANSGRIVFKASAATAAVTFANPSDASRRVLLNGVSLQPYFYPQD